MKRIIIHDFRPPLPGDHPRISFLHTTVFHGETTRGGKELSVAPKVRYANEVRIPLDVKRSGRFVPKLFAPLTHWIVAEEIKHKLDHLPNLEFLQVRFQKLIDFPIPATGDFSWYTENEYHSRDPGILLKKMPDVPEFHATIGNYYELLAPRTVDVADQYSDLTQIHVELGDSLSVPIDPFVSEPMFRDYPILLYGAYLLSEEAFQIVEEYIDWDYFLKTTVEI